MGTNRPAGPVLTIVTPVLNAAEFLPGAIESVRRARTLGCPIELILADGGSTDGSLEMARAASSGADADWIRLREGPDSGQADAINSSFAEARGRYLGWLNADDRYRPEGLAACVGVLERAQADVVVGRCVFVDKAGRVIFRPVPPDPVSPASLLRLLSGWYAGRSLVQPEVFVARRVFELSGGLDVSLHYTMDHEFWLRLSAAGYGFRLVDCLVAEQLAHPGQKTADNAAVVAEQLEYCERYIQNNGFKLGDDRPQIVQELERLRRKLGVARRMIVGLQGHGVWAGPGTNAALDDEILWRLGRMTRQPRSLACVGLDDAEISRIREQFRLTRPPVVSRSIPRVASSFDVIVMRSAGGAMERQAVHQALKPGGRAAILGEPDPERQASAVQQACRTIGDRITLNTPTLLPGQRDASLLDRLERAPAVAQPTPDVVGLELVDRVSFGSLKDHRILSLFQGVIPQSEPGLWRSVIVRKPAVSGR